MKNSGADVEEVLKTLIAGYEATSVVNLTFRRNMLLHVQGSSQISVPLKMMALCAFETSGTDHLLTWRHLL